ncbi:hypothetical protein CLOM_g20777 [Closterium sp. NIES-68]|nr:hypothetical protein CLOM_g20777 [Closterium sp. NIES-68]GJP83501.1 hypothetical protein CLOP_g13647 [Closterium sp. NIES-67]
MMRTGRESEVRTQKKVEEALRTRMKERALKECHKEIEAYAECVRGRVFSIVWACRAHSNDLNNCLHQYTNDAVLDQYKRDYMEQQQYPQQHEQKQEQP